MSPTSRATIAAALAVALLWPAAPSAAQDPDVRMRASATSTPLAATNRSLTGVGWDPAPFAAEEMEPLRPDLVRIDAGIERLYPDDTTLDKEAFDALEAEVEEIVAIGGEPVVILSYTPTWLADDRPTSDQTKVPPANAADWKALVRQVVDGLVEAGARWFEVWNEPDFPVFFQGTIQEFLDRIYRPSAEAVSQAATHHGLDLRFGGCACLFPDPGWIIPMMAYARGNDLPLDFLSWHYYGNYPFIGPDGREPLGPEQFRELVDPLRRENPATTASSYADQVRGVRSWRDAVYADAPDEAPELVIDEWNLSAGGFDKRHDTHVGAAFDGAVLVEMQRSGLDRAAYFRSVDPDFGADVVDPEPELYGGWGLVGREGTRKPAWWAFRLFRVLGDDVIAHSPEEAARTLGVSAVLARTDPTELQLYVANFHASSPETRTIELVVDDAAVGRWLARSRTVDATVGADQAPPVRTRDLASDGVLRLELTVPAQSVTFVRLDRTGG